MKKQTEAKLLTSISDASRILGVSEATLRQWTDEGLIKAYITPGGHRRYGREQLDEFIRSHEKMLGIKDLVAKLEDTAEPHRELGASTLVQTRSKLSPAKQHNLAVLGRRILNAIILYVSAPARRHEAMVQVCAAGADFGTSLAQDGLTITESIQAFSAHRAPIVESVAEMLRQREMVAEGILAAIPLIDEAMDKALIALVEAYQAQARA
jgi:excisionase family DNA binding protein